MNLVDEQGRKWIAVEHTHADHKIDGPVHHKIARSASILLNGIRTQCFLGAAHRAVRVNFRWEASRTWWHITQLDQREDRQGRLPNFYPIVAEMIGMP